jgi:hypothetical protein
MKTPRTLVLTAAAAAIIAGSSFATGIVMGVATDAGGTTRPPVTPAQSTTGPVPQGNTGADVSLALAAGEYVATWDLNASVFTGGCGLVVTTNVTPTFSGDTTALITVRTGGGTLTIHCAGNGTGGVAELTATRTTIH